MIEKSEINSLKEWLLVEENNNALEISVEETHRFINNGDRIVLLDVREEEEIALGYIPGAIFIPMNELKKKIEILIPEKDVPIIIYCAIGVRSLTAVKILKEMGYKNVLSMAKGIEEWEAKGYEVVNDSKLTPKQLTRYNRHILLKEVGLEGQMKLLKAKVLLVGAGGLGCPAGLYLAAAGVGTIGIIDYDNVDLTNLQRQILHSTYDVGRPKTESAKDAISMINPEIKVITYQERLTHENAFDIFKNYDIIIDGSDNFPTKYLINDACFFIGKPYIYGGVFQFEGQVSVFHPKGGGPCLRCIFPEPPPPGTVPS
jgi:adenylyltransferase/sulfurtransferase